MISWSNNQLYSLNFFRSNLSLGGDVLVQGGGSVYPFFDFSDAVWQNDLFSLFVLLFLIEEGFDVGLYWVALQHSQFLCLFVKNSQNLGLGGWTSLVDSWNDVYFFQRLNHNCFRLLGVFRILFCDELNNLLYPRFRLLSYGDLAWSKHFFLDFSCSSGCVSSFDDLHLWCSFIEDRDHLSSLVFCLVSENRNHFDFVGILSWWTLSHDSVGHACGSGNFVSDGFEYGGRGNDGWVVGDGEFGSSDKINWELSIDVIG